MPLGELAGGILQLLRPQVAGRRVDEVATEPNPFDNGECAALIDAARNLELCNLLGLARLVAAKTIGAEAPGDGGQLRVAEVVGEMIAARRQHAGQVAEGQLRLVHGIARARLAEPEDGAGKRALGARQ